MSSIVSVCLPFAVTTDDWEKLGKKKCVTKALYHRLDQMKNQKETAKWFSLLSAVERAMTVNRLPIGPI